jgi:hypothetical protein
MRRTADNLRKAVQATGLVEPSIFDEATRRALSEKAKAAICRPMAMPHDTKVKAHG